MPKFGRVLSKLKSNYRRRTFPSESPSRTESVDSAFQSTFNSGTTSGHYLNSSSSGSGQIELNVVPQPVPAPVEEDCSHAVCETPTDTPATSVEPEQNPARVTNLVALFRYRTRNDGDIGFEKGETMVLLDKSNSDWWYVQLNRNGEEGFAPRNFLAEIDNLDSQEWFGGQINRGRAERLVLSTRLPRGTFVVRERRGSHGSDLALTIRDVEKDDCVARHYKIRRFNGGYCITRQRIFPTIHSMITHYCSNVDGLCSVLTFPAPKTIPTVPDLSPGVSKKWDIPRDEFEIKRTLGKGHFGEVFFGKWRQFVDVAIKTVRHNRMNAEEFLREARIMKECDHPHLVKLYAVCVDEEPYWIITEYLENGDLRKYLSPSGGGAKVAWTCLIDIAAQVASAMAYLEAHQPHPIIHRDLAARNVLVGKKVSGVPTVKVADFGLARILPDEDVYTQGDMNSPLPYRWSSPEAILTRKFTVKSDVWSFGVLLWEIMTRGATPYDDLQIATKDIVNLVISKNYRLQRPVDCPLDVYQVMRLCWDDDPDRRPSFERLYHVFDDYFVSVQPNPFSPAPVSVSLSVNE